MQHAQAQPPPLREQVPSLTPAVEEVVLRALAKDAKDRFASVQEFAVALVVAIEQSKPRSVPQKTKEQWLKEGLISQNAGKYKEAIEAYNYAIKLDPKYASAYNNRGAAYSGLKEYVRAIEDYSHAIALNPRFAAAYFNRGIAYGELEEYVRAIWDFNQAIDLNPRFTAAYYNRGIAHIDMKEYTKAIGDFSRVIALDPRDAEAYG